MLLISAAATFIIACGDDRNAPDVSQIKVDVKINRLEQAIFAIDTNHIAQDWRSFSAKYPEFAAVFPRVIGVNTADSLKTLEALTFFLKDIDIRKQYDTCMTSYKDVRNLESDLSQAFKYYKYYFPRRTIPQVNSCVSGLNYGCFIYGDSVPSIGISWEFYLGKGYTGYEYNGDRFPRYVARSMNREHLVSKVVENLAQDVLGEAAGNRLIDIMVNNGKKLYIIDKLLPFAPDSVKLEYTAAQTTWIVDNEANLWSHFTNENLLYSTKMDEIRKLVSPSPNAPKMPAEAPGKTANWIGFQIIKAYMKRFPNTSMDALLALPDAQKILEMSKYKPKR